MGWEDEGVTCVTALFVIVCRTRSNCIVKIRELKLGRSNIVFSQSTYPISLFTISTVVGNFRERNMAHRKPGKGISPVFGNLHIVHKLRRFNFHRIKENAGVGRLVKGRL